MNWLDGKVSLRLGGRMLGRGALTPRRLGTLAGNLWAYIRRAPVAAPAPSLLVIEPARFCNLQCTGCGYHMKGLMHSAEMLQPAQLARLLADAGDRLLLVVFHLAGEPFLNKQLLPLLQLLRRHKVGIILNSNGNFRLTDEQQEQLLADGPDIFIVSISGITQAVYGDYHQGGDIELVKANLRALTARQRSGGPAIIVRYLQHERNGHEVAAAQAFAREIGAFAFDLRRISPEFDAAQFGDFQQRRQTGGTLPPLPACPNLWLTAEIRADGGVLPCCYEWYDIPTLGNAYAANATLAAVWNGAPYQGLRRMFADPAAPKLPACYLCRIKFGFQDRKD